MLVILNMMMVTTSRLVLMLGLLVAPEGGRHGCDACLQANIMR